MRIAIIGAGAMGSLLGFYLSIHAEVWLLDPWEEHMAAIRTVGIICRRKDAWVARPDGAVSDPAMIPPCDTIIILVKAPQTGWAAEQVAKLAAYHDKPPAIVYTLQNGIGNRELLAERLGAARVGQGVSSLGATLLGPGHVLHAGMGPTIFGTAPDAARAAELAALFRACGLPAEVSDDLESLIWGKLMANVAINALTALLRVPNRAVAEVPAVRELAAAAVREAAAVAAARGIKLPYDDPVAHALNIAAATGANRSSMLQDVLRGAPTEISTINGAVSREGHRLGVPTPLNDMLSTLVEALDATCTMREG